MDLKKLLKQLNSFAFKKGLINDSEDFAQYAIFKLHQGRKASFNQLFIDYLRKEFGEQRHDKYTIRKRSISVSQILSFENNTGGAYEWDQWNRRYLDEPRILDIKAKVKEQRLQNKIDNLKMKIIKFKTKSRLPIKTVERFCRKDLKKINVMEKLLVQNLSTFETILNDSNS